MYGRIHKIVFVIAAMIFVKKSFCQDIIEFFTPEEAYLYALENNEVIGLSREKCKLNHDKARKNFGVFIPSLIFSFSDSAFINDNSMDSKNKNVSMGLNFLLFDGGENLNNYKMEKSIAEYEILENEESILEERITICNLFFSIIILKKKLVAKKKLLDNFTSQRKIMEREKSLGYVIENELLDFDIRMNELEDEIMMTKGNLELTLMEIKNLIGMNYEASLIINMRDDDSFVEKPLLDFFEFIFSSSRSKNLALEKLKIEYEYLKTKKKIDDRWWMPNISIQPTIAFDGTTYPLRKDKVQVNFSFSFSRNPFVEGNESTSFSIRNKKLKGNSNNLGLSSKNNFSWYEERKLQNLMLKEKDIERKKQENCLYSKIYQMLLEHDNLLNSLNRMRKTYEVMERKKEVAEKQMESGYMTYLDFIDHIIQMSEKEILIIQYETNIKKIESQIEILTGRKMLEFNDAVHN